MLRPNAEEARRRQAASAGRAGAAGKPRRRDRPARRGVRRGDRARRAPASARSRSWCRRCRRCSSRVTAATATWPVQPRIVVDPAEKRAAFRDGARGAGEIGHGHAGAGARRRSDGRGLPGVGGRGLHRSRRLVRVPSVILANLVIGENVVPEFLQEACTAENLADSARAADRRNRRAPASDRSLCAPRFDHGNRRPGAGRPRRRYRFGPDWAFQARPLPGPAATL